MVKSRGAPNVINTRLHEDSDQRGRPPRNKFAKIFNSVLYHFLTVRKQTGGTAGLKTTSVTDNVIDWPLQNKTFGCPTA